MAQQTAVEWLAKEMEKQQGGDTITLPRFSSFEHTLNSMQGDAEALAC